MKPIHIPSLLRLPDQTDTLEFNDPIADLDTLTPVQGKLSVIHRGTYLEVSGQATTIVTLMCDRCLQQYNHRLTISPSEFIWLREPDVLSDSVEALLDHDLSSEDLVESLNPQGHFDVETWVYEQLCLEIPLQKLCDNACEGISVTSNQTSPLMDRRWSALESLKQQIDVKELDVN